jgi:hypothetical protein
MSSGLWDRPSRMTERDPLLAPFEALIGTWDTEATHPLFDGVVQGSATYEWLEGGQFVVLRSRNDHEKFPDAIGVIGRPESGEGLVMEYFDSRGLRRTYGVSVEDGDMRWWRDHPGFDQRVFAKLGADEFEFVSQLAETPGEWRDDLKATYRRRA